MTASGGSVPPPTLLSLMMAAGVVSDKRYGECSVIGIMGSLRFGSFPAMIRRLYYFAEVTNARGMLEIGYRIVDPNDERVPIWRWNDESFDVASPLDVVTMYDSADNVQFPRPGSYRLQAWCGNRMLGERRLNLFQADGEEGQQ